MGTDNQNNRITDLSSPELIAQITADMSAAVQDVTEAFLAAVREHPAEMLEAQEQYFGKSL
jgi:hypothetical protein